MTVKTQRKTKAGRGPSKIRAPRNGRSPARKTASKSTGKYPLSVYEHLHIGIVQAAPDGRYLDVSDEFCRILGYSRKELLQLSVKDCTHEDDYILDIKLYEQLVAGQIPFYGLEKRYIRKDGKIVWVELTRSLVRDEAGKPLCTMGVVIDISDRKHVERVLRESGESLRLATEAARMFKWELDLQKQVYTFADNFSQVLGFSAGLLPQNSFETVRRLSPEEDVQAMSDAVAHAIVTHSDLNSLPYRVIDPANGETVWLELSAKVAYDEAGNAQRLFGVAQNITESKKAQEQIRTISTMSAENPNPLMRLTADGRVLYANTPGQDLLAAWRQQTRQTIPDELQQSVSEVFHSGLKKQIEIEHEQKVFLCTLVPIREAGHVNFYGSDITERKLAEKALRKSEERFRAIVNQATAGIAESDRDTRLIFANPKLCEMLGYSESELIGKTIWELTYSDDLDENQRLFEPMLAEGESSQFEKRFIRKDGSRLWANVSVTKVRDRAGKPTGGVSVVVDINERKHAEQALAEFARQQEALYRLSDELHHISSLEDVYNAALDAIRTGLQCDRASILLFDETGVMRFVAWRGLSEAYRGVTEGHSPWEADEQNPYPICISDIRTADLSDSLKAAIQAEGIGGLAFIPLLLNGKLIGKFMVYFNEPHDCNDVEIELGLMIARQLAFGIDQKRAEAQLRESEERFRVLADSAPILIWVNGADGGCEFVNKEYLRYFGKRLEEVLGFGWQPSLHPDDQETYVGAYMAAFHARAPFRAEVRILNAEGEYRWIDSYGMPRYGARGEFLGYNGISYDITERKRTEEQLRKAAEFDAFRVALTDTLRPLNDPAKILTEAMRLLGEKIQVDRVLYSEIENDNETIVIFDNYVKDGVPRLTGRASLKDYGKARGPLNQGQNLIIADATTSADMDEKDRASFAALGIGSGLAIPLIKEGRWTATLGVHNGAARAWTENEIKFTEETAERTWSALERARAQERLRASETLYRTIARSIPGGGVYVVDKDFRYLIAEGTTTETFGLTRAMLEGRTVSEVFPDERGTRMEDRLRRVFAGETISFETKNNERVFWTQLAPLLDSIGQVLILTLDITERKRAEEALRVENERFMRFVNSNIIGILIGDSNGKVTLANDYYLNLLGVSRQDFLENKVDWKEFTPPEWLSADEKAIQELRERGVCEPYEKEYVRSDGRRVPVYLADALLPGPGGEIAAFVLDITERKRAEEALRQSEERFVRFMQHLPGLAWIKDLQGRYVYANAAAEKAFGAAGEKLYHKTDREIFPPHVAEEFRKNDAQALLSEKGMQTVESLRQEDEVLHFSLVTKFPIPGPDGQPALIGGTALDITERLQADEALRKSEERYRTLFDRVPVAVYTCDARGLIQEYNQRAVELWGREPKTNDPSDKYCGSYKLCYPDGTFMPHAECLLARVLTGETPEQVEEEVIIVRPDGSRRTIIAHPLLLKNPRGQITGAINCFYDITERKQAIQALYESEERFKAILRQATAGIVRKDAEGKFIFVNQAFCSMLGYTEADLLGKAFWQFVYTEDQEENKRLYDRLMLEGVPFKLEKRLIRRDGSMIWVDVSVSPVMDAEGKPQSAVAVEVDITARKQAEASLQQLNLQLESRVQRRTATIQAMNQSLRDEIAERKRIEEALRASEAVARANEEKLRTLFDLLPVGISFLDPRGRILQMNSALANIVHLSKDQLLGEMYQSRKYIRADGTQMPPAEFASARALATGRTVYNVETGILLENGEVLWTSVSAAPVAVADVGVVIVTVDITDRKRAERDLQESHARLRILSQRLVEVQEEERRALARELHDRVGQTLAALNINLIIISGQLSPDTAQQIGARLNDSMKLVAETIALVRDVMTDLRPSVLDDYGLESALESQLSKFTARYNIKAMLKKPESPLPRLGPSIEMTFLRITQEALMNIARHAHAEHVSMTLRQAEKYICLTIQDDGIGIESWQEANRPGSHGLTIMRERADAFGGELQVSSVPGQGTIVEISIPFRNNAAGQTQKGGR